MSTRIWLKTIKKLRMLSALTGKSIVALLEELADVALEKAQAKEKDL